MKILFGLTTCLVHKFSIFKLQEKCFLLLFLKNKFLKIENKNGYQIYPKFFVLFPFSFGSEEEEKEKRKKRR